MRKIKLYHGSPMIIEKPVFGKGKAYNDYGRGFYCTEHIELAKEWSCGEETDGYANQYELCTDGLKILDLSDEQIGKHGFPPRLQSVAKSGFCIIFCPTARNTM